MWLFEGGGKEYSKYKDPEEEACLMRPWSIMAGAEWQ